MFHQTLMSVRNLASVLTVAVRTSLVRTVACATRASFHLQTAKCAVVSNVCQTLTWQFRDYVDLIMQLSWQLCGAEFEVRNPPLTLGSDSHKFFFPLSSFLSKTDIDECEDVRLCAYGLCINTEGSFQCQCYPGYQRTQEGSHCEGMNYLTSQYAII